MAPIVWSLPLPGNPIGASGIIALGFIPRSISVRNYSNQALYLTSSVKGGLTQILQAPELIVPARTVYNAPFGIRSEAREFGYRLPGSSWNQQSTILAYLYDCELFDGDDVYQLPPDLAPNAMETYEKSATVAGLTPGGSLASGATDSYQLQHQTTDLTLAADGQPMLFQTGMSATDLTSPFTLYPGERVSLGAGLWYVNVKNLGSAAGGYRIQSLFVSATI